MGKEKDNKFEDELDDRSRELLSILSKKLIEFEQSSTAGAVVVIRPTDKQYSGEPVDFGEYQTTGFECDESHYISGLDQFFNVRYIFNSQDELVIYLLKNKELHKKKLAEVLSENCS